MRKKNMIININYDDKNKMVYIKRYNKKEELINICNMTDDTYNKIQKHIRKSMKYCKYYNSNKIFIVILLLLIIAVINFKFPSTLVSSFILLSSAFCWNYSSNLKKIEKENTIELINKFIKSSFNDDYCKINTQQNISSLIIKNDMNKKNLKKDEEISVDNNIISIICNIRDMIISLNSDKKYFYCQRLNMLIDEYKELRNNFLSEEEKVRFLAKLIILTTEVEKLHENNYKNKKKILEK